MPKPTSNLLETFPNPASENDFWIRMQIPEFTCLCPKTGQPDFATLYLDYLPNKKCVELKSLKLYMASFRDKGAFHEAITNKILNDLASLTKPKFMRLTARFYVRDGIFTTIIVEHKKKGFKPENPIQLPELSNERATY